MFASASGLEPGALVKLPANSHSLEMFAPLLGTTCNFWDLSVSKWKVISFEDIADILEDHIRFFGNGGLEYKLVNID